MPPTAKRTARRLLRAWLLGLLVFGYGPAITYGWLVWLLNEEQWRWTYLMYCTEVPLVGGLCVLLIPWLRFQPIRHALREWAQGTPVDRVRCAMVYERALRLPLWVAVSAFIATCIGYIVGTSVVHWQADQPIVEILKTLPASPLVGGLMGAFCYFGTVRALHPVVAWCSVQLRHVRSSHRSSLSAKFLTTTCILAISTLCLLEPAAYTLSQMITEQHVIRLSSTQLQLVAHQLEHLDRNEDQVAILRQALQSGHGYLYAIDNAGRIVTPHPRGYATIEQEHFYHLASQLQGRTGAWVDRYGEHRVVAFARLAHPRWTLIAVSFPSDITVPLRHFMQFSWLAILEVLFVVVLFGRYFTHGITIPLAELTQAAQRIAERGDLFQYVPGTTDDELGELAHAFNRMVTELRESRANVEEYTRRLERSTQELSALNQEMEDLLRVVSHDLRAPLINIQGFSQRLGPVMKETVKTLDHLAASNLENGLRSQVESLKTGVQTRFGESLRFISKGIEKMDTLLSLLLAVSRVGRKADPIQLNDLNRLLDDVLAVFDHQLKERAIQVIRHPLPSRVPCRRNEINQVLSNLLSNAIAYMGATGERFIEIGGSERSGDVECFVRDTGIGIAPEDQERIFQMFTRLQAIDVSGEGVGLAYVKKILRSHGGTIRVVSHKGQGSTFLFTLPMPQPGSTIKGGVSR